MSDCHAFKNSNQSWQQSPRRRRTFMSVVRLIAITITLHYYHRLLKGSVSNLNELPNERWCTSLPLRCDLSLGARRDARGTGVLVRLLLWRASPMLVKVGGRGLAE